MILSRHLNRLIPYSNHLSFLWIWLPPITIAYNLLYPLFSPLYYHSPFFLMFEGLWAKPPSSQQPKRSNQLPSRLCSLKCESLSSKGLSRFKISKRGSKTQARPVLRRGYETAWVEAVQRYFSNISTNYTSSNWNVWIFMQSKDYTVVSFFDHCIVDGKICQHFHD